MLGAHRAAACRSCSSARSQLADRRAERIATPELNRFVGDLVAPAAAAQRQAGGACASTTRPRSDRRPPRFAIQVNDRRLITRDWAFHLENRLREAYALEGVPLVIDFVPHTRRARARGRDGGVRRASVSRLP